MSNEYSNTQSGFKRIGFQINSPHAENEHRKPTTSDLKRLSHDNSGSQNPMNGASFEEKNMAFHQEMPAYAPHAERAVTTRRAQEYARSDASRGADPGGNDENATLAVNDARLQLAESVVACAALVGRLTKKVTADPSCS